MKASVMTIPLITNDTNMTKHHLQELYESNINNNQSGDATWILTSAFIIFTMQSGFGLLEAGTCSSKNECNIMVKNAVDVLFGALGYYICGYAFSFGNGEHSNAFTGVGHFFLQLDGEEYGSLFAHYFFQLSFATTATTIVSGGMAERTNLKAYMFFSFINFFSYVFPAHWIWADKGFLRQMGAADIGGCGPVHLIGGVSALVATIMLKPRHGMFKEDKKEVVMASPTNVVLGTFMLWWGWLGFNCGSTFGVSGGKWKRATRAAVTTVNSSVSGGLWAIFYCYVLTNYHKKKLDVGEMTSCILGGLVAITACCATCEPWEALIIGLVGGIVTSYGARLLKHLHIDDPVQCIPVHLFSAVWGVLAVGIFGEEDKEEKLSFYNGLTKGGSFKALGVQLLAAVSFIVWGAATSFIELLVAHKIFGLRLTLEEELMGADEAEHGIKNPNASSNNHAVGRDVSIRPANEFSQQDLELFHKFKQFLDSEQKLEERETKFFRNIKARALKRSQSDVGEEKVRQRQNYNRQNNNQQIYSDQNGMINFGYLSIRDSNIGNLSTSLENRRMVEEHRREVVASEVEEAFVRSSSNVYFSNCNVQKQSVEKSISLQK